MRYRTRWRRSASRRDKREKIYSELLAQVSGVDNVMKQVQIQSGTASARKPLKDAGATPEDDMEIYNRLSGQFQPAFDKLSRGALAGPRR